MAGLCYDTQHVEAMTFPVAMPDKTPCALSEDFYQEKLPCTDIEQVLREKKPFILRCMLDGIKKLQGRIVKWNRCALSVSITWA
jgi:hypothetical protein